MRVFSTPSVSDPDRAFHGLTLVKLAHADIEKLFGRR